MSIVELDWQAAVWRLQLQRAWLVVQCFLAMCVAANHFLYSLFLPESQSNLFLANALLLLGAGVKHLPPLNMRHLVDLLPPSFPALIERFDALRRWILRCIVIRPMLVHGECKRLHWLE